MISIVLPTYNGARYLRESLDSCLAQADPDWELIIVDDCSTDDTPALVAEYVARDSRIRALRNPVNRRLPASLNEGFAHARGELLTWTSDDNRFRPAALQRMREHLEANPAADLVYTDFSVIDAAGRRTGPGWTGPAADLPFRDVVGACFLYRRALHDRLRGYDDEMALVEDYDFWLRASVEFRLEWLREDLYEYRWHDRSLTTTQETRIRLAHQRCLARNLPRLAWMNADLRAAAEENLAFLTQEALLLRDLEEVVPAGPFILVDDNTVRLDGPLRERRIPFMEKDGEYWGQPEDDAAALREFERLRGFGATSLVFTWSSRWWLEHYRGLREHLQRHYPRRAETGQLLAFDLRTGA